MLFALRLVKFAVNAADGAFVGETHDWRHVQMMCWGGGGWQADEWTAEHKCTYHINNNAKLTTFDKFTLTAKRSRSGPPRTQMFTCAQFPFIDVSHPICPSKWHLPIVLLFFTPTYPFIRNRYLYYTKIGARAKKLCRFWWMEFSTLPERTSSVRCSQTIPCQCGREKIICSQQHAANSGSSVSSKGYYGKNAETPSEHKFLTFTQIYLNSRSCVVVSFDTASGMCFVLLCANDGNAKICKNHQTSEHLWVFSDKLWSEKCGHLATWRYFELHWRHRWNCSL